MSEFSFLNLNGKIFPVGGKYFPSTNRAFRYGDGLFEGMRLMSGEILFFENHMERLFDGMHALQLSIPENFSSAYFFTLITELLRANKILNDVLIRIQVFRSGEGLYEPTTNEIEFLIELLPAPADGFIWNEKGISVGIFSEWKKELNPSMSFKTSNSLVYVMGSLWKKKNNLDDALIVNAAGNICDATSSNVFFWKNKKLFTPVLSDGAVRGITRKNLIAFCHAQNISITEKSISENELLNADEIFLTNISKGIRKVEALNGKQFSNEMTKELALDFYNTLQKK
ncbi:MAG TPA: aminotransferase IV [Bacteroidetes bacterium]|nr:aminotransferase IV [Bacteroidota bacterium]